LYLNEENIPKLTENSEANLIDSDEELNDEKNSMAIAAM
jgi:hypothetical protein